MSMTIFGIYLAIYGYILYRVNTLPDDWWRW